MSGDDCINPQITLITQIVANEANKSDFKHVDEDLRNKEDDDEAVPSLVAGEDYYFEGAMMVFTERFLLRRGFCCESGCRHCPYGFSKK